jgi:hypothetical protein
MMCVGAYFGLTRQETHEVYTSRMRAHGDVIYGCWRRISNRCSGSAGVEWPLVAHLPFRRERAADIALHGVPAPN